MLLDIKCKRSFTLIELLTVMVIAALVINGVIMSIVNSMVLNEYNQELTIAMNIARAEIEESISQKTSFSSIVSESGESSSKLTLEAHGLDGCKRKYVTPIIADELVNVKVYVCWQGRGGRKIGNCANPPACTVPANNALQSPVVLETAVAQR